MLHLRKTDPGYDRLPDVQQMTNPTAGLGTSLCKSMAYQFGGKQDRVSQGHLSCKCLDSGGRDLFDGGPSRPLVLWRTRLNMGNRSQTLDGVLITLHSEIQERSGVNDSEIHRLPHTTPTSSLVQNVYERCSQFPNKVRSNSTRLSQPIQRDHRSVFARYGGFNFVHRVFQISDERINDRDGQGLQRNIEKGWRKVGSRRCLTVTAICTAAGFCRAFKCHPFLPIVSQIFRTLIPKPSFVPKATTDTGGLPRM